jgi:hypothetical protein
MPPKSKSDCRHPWTVRLLAILLGLLPLVMIEVVLVLLEYPNQPATLDPYVELKHLKPLFTLDQAAGEYRIGEERARFFRPASFKTPKLKGTFRIFSLGGSTTQGEPYSTETAFPEWLKLNLQLLSPDSKFESINCGGLSYASYRVLAIAREVLDYEPDCIVVYTGHNEFLERRSYADVAEPDSFSQVVNYLQHMRTVRCLKSWATDSPHRDMHKSLNEMKEEVDALLDYEGGLQDYRRNDPWRDRVVEHFRWNIAQLMILCKSKGVPVVFVRPVSNLLDCPPIKFEVDPALSMEERSAFNEAWEAARRAPDATSAGQLVEAALQHDPKHAGALFLKGKLHAEMGEWELAKKYLTAARDDDVCPLRALSSISQAVTAVADQQQVPCVDAEALFADVSEHGIVGQRWLVDHVHPTFEGHQLLGETIAEVFVNQKLVKITNSKWRDQRATVYREHLKTLGEEYFHRGKQRLEGLLLWTQGRAKKVRQSANSVPGRYSAN